MSTPDLLVAFSKFIIKRAIGKVRINDDSRATEWYCSACKARAEMSVLALDKEKENINHKEDCIYLQAKAVMLLQPEKEDGTVQKP